MSEPLGIHAGLEQLVPAGDACITCGDVAVEARVVEVGDGGAVVERDGAREHVAVDLLDGVQVGDVLLCHAGVALETLERAGGVALRRGPASPGGSGRRPGP